MPKYKKEDIERIGRRYRTMPSQLSQTEVATQLQIPLSTLRTWIGRYNWERDLSDEVKRRTNIAVSKSMLGVETDKPLSDEEQAITERVALNVALITQHQDWLSGFGETLTLLKTQHHEQVKSLEVAIPDDKAPSGYRFAKKALGSSINEARGLISTFKDFVEQQRLAYGISAEGDGNDVDVDSYLRELAEEMAAEEAEAGTAQE